MSPVSMFIQWPENLNVHITCTSVLVNSKDHRAEEWYQAKFERAVAKRRSASTNAKAAKLPKTVVEVSRMLSARELDSITSLVYDPKAHDCEDMPNGYFHLYGAAECRLREIARERGILEELQAIERKRDSPTSSLRDSLDLLADFADLEVAQSAASTEFNLVSDDDTSSSHSGSCDSSDEEVPQVQTSNKSTKTAPPKKPLNTLDRFFVADTKVHDDHASLALQFPIDPEAYIAQKRAEHEHKLKNNGYYAKYEWPAIQNMAKAVTYPRPKRALQVDDQKPKRQRRKSVDAYLAEGVEGL